MSSVMILRRGIVALDCAVTAACVSAGPKVEAPDSAEVVDVPEKMAYGISSSGAAHILGAVLERDGHFPSGAEDFKQIAALLEPLKAGGLACSSPSIHVRPGYIVWRQVGIEVRRVEWHTLCYAGGERPRAKNADTAWQLMESWGRERFVARPSVPQGGADGCVGRTADGTEEAFAISPKQFSELRTLFWEYEGRHFECDRIIAYLPWGDVVWLAEDGRELQRTRLHEGCFQGTPPACFTGCSVQRVVSRFKCDSGIPRAPLTSDTIFVRPAGDLEKL